ncbi:COMM domain-containing protein 3 [Coccinella septempunctata]|uniref:COMM domain-containing protein 3 n=1 Tax=Coccinella septempunctata TaxID=41139 RepID=UPI001D08C753|nr:COMM domain-containing protein 3 [Coccinella septempunctata]
MMQLRESTKKSLRLLNNAKVVSDETCKKLLDDCFSVLGGGEELHANASLFGSKPDLVKELYANLLIATAEFVRNGASDEDVRQYLLEECNVGQARSDLYSKLYSVHKLGVEITLLNIGSHPPHVVDVDWKIDFVVKSNSLDQCGGPIFRIGFTMEKFDEGMGCKKTEYLNFTCNSQEMQDLVYKLKDAVRHCQRMSTDL